MSLHIFLDAVEDGTIRPSNTSALHDAVPLYVKDNSADYANSEIDTEKVLSNVKTMLERDDLSPEEAEFTQAFSLVILRSQILAFICTNFVQDEKTGRSLLSEFRQSIVFKFMSHIASYEAQEALLGDFVADYVENVCNDETRASLEALLKCSAGLLAEMNLFVTTLIAEENIDSLGQLAINLQIVSALSKDLLPESFAGAGSIKATSEKIGLN